MLWMFLGFPQQAFSAMLAQDLEAGNLALEKGEYDIAVLHFLKLLESENASQAPEIYQSLGLAYFHSGYYSLALDAFKIYETLAAQKISVEVNYYIAYCHYEMENYEAAQVYLKRLTDSPQLTDALRIQVKQMLITSNAAYQNALDAYLQGDYQVAIEWFEQMPNELSQTAEIQVYLGSAYYSLRNYQKASEYFMAAEKLGEGTEFGEKAQEYLKIISLITKNQPLKPFEIAVTLGTFGDSNLNLGGSLNSTNTQPESIDKTLSDLGASLNLRARYQFNNELQSNYQLTLNQYTGLLSDAQILDDTDNTLMSQQYNRVLQTLDLNGRYSLSKSQVLTLLTQTRWDIFGGKSFNYAATIQPALNIYLTERLVSRINFALSGEYYPEFSEWSNTNYQLGLEQYIYLWTQQTWLRFYFYHRNFLANDQARSHFFQQNNQIFEQLSRRAFSRSSNQLGLNFQFPLGVPTLEIGSNLTFVDYSQPELFNLYQIVLNPITGLPLPKLPLTEQSGLRQDTLLQFYLDLEWLISQQTKLNLTYTRNTNSSNIHPSVINIGERNYNYLRDLLELKLMYIF